VISPVFKFLSRERGDMAGRGVKLPSGVGKQPLAGRLCKSPGLRGWEFPLGMARVRGGLSPPDGAMWSSAREGAVLRQLGCLLPFPPTGYQGGGC
jgi:hypothetical protein